jgi:spermidine synthase
MCEIDQVLIIIDNVYIIIFQLVIDVSKKYLPRMSSGFNSPKLTLHVGDGFEFLKTHKNAFDIIITDSSDPIGPAESLFGEQYYRLVREALTSDGILASQGKASSSP